MNEKHKLGDILNEAVRLRPATDMSQPKASHVTFSEMFWETLSSSFQSEETIGELNRIINFLLTQSKHEVCIERAIWFIAFVFGRMLGDESDEKKASARAYVSTLCDRTQCENKTVRYRCCQCLRLVMEALPGGEIDEDMMATIYATLLPRVQDKAPEVRSQTLSALRCFMIPGEDNQYNDDQVVAAYLKTLKKDPHPSPRATVLQFLPAIPASIKSICERTKDISPIVRVEAFRRIRNQISPEQLEIKQRGDIMVAGLNERVERVQKEAVETLLTWFHSYAQGDVVVGFELFDCKTHSEVYSLALNAILIYQPSIILEWSKTNAKLETILSPFRALFWKTLLCGCKYRSIELGQDAAMDPARSSEVQSLCDAIDRWLPSELSNLVQIFADHFHRQETFQCLCILDILIACYNFTDENDHEVGSELYRFLCHNAVENVPKWYEAVVALGKAIWSNSADFVTHSLTPFEEKHNVQMEAVTPTDPEFLHWLHLSIVKMKVVPLRESSTLRNPEKCFGVADILTVLRFAIPNATDELKWIIEAMGLCLRIKMSREDHETCLPEIWKALENNSKEIVKAAINALCTLGMCYGVRKVDLGPPSNTLTPPFDSIQDYRILDRDEDRSLPLTFSNMIHWEQRIDSEILVVTAQSLCKLLIINDRYHQIGMSVGESIQCLSSLVALFVYEDGEDPSGHLKQCLQVFFDRYAQMNVTHQVIFRIGFIPILRYSLEKAVVLGLQTNHVVQFLSNLLVAPIRNQNQTESENQELKGIIAQTNAELVCLLIWEIAHCPMDRQTSKGYVAALWKVVTFIPLENCASVDRQNIITLVKDFASKKKLQPKPSENLIAKLNFDDIEALNAEDFESLKRRLHRFMSQFEKHPLSIDANDD